MFEVMELPHRYQARVSAYAWLLIDEYPWFQEEGGSGALRPGYPAGDGAGPLKEFGRMGRRGTCLYSCDPRSSRGCAPGADGYADPAHAAADPRPAQDDDLRRWPAAEETEAAAVASDRAVDARQLLRDPARVRQHRRLLALRRLHAHHGREPGREARRAGPRRHPAAGRRARHRARHRLRPSLHGRVVAVAVRHVHAGPDRSKAAPGVAALVPARPVGADPGLRERPNQRRVLRRRTAAGVEPDQAGA